jgi:transposase
MNPGRARRTQRLEFKQSAVEASRQLGASIAGVAMSHGINANPLHKGCRQFSGSLNTVGVIRPSLIRITVVRDEPVRSSADNSTPGRIDIELGSARVSLTGRVDSVVVLNH